jgi:hypothetical protein
MTILSRCAAFWSDKNANFGMMFAILSLPLVITVGAGLDFSRQSSARAHLQDMVDATALSLATSPVRDEETLRALANELLDANRRGGLLEQFDITSLLPTEADVELGVRGSIKASFIRFGRQQRRDVELFQEPAAAPSKPASWASSGSTDCR